MAQKANPKKSSITDDPRASQALQHYETGLRALQEHKFDKAKPLFQKVLGRRHKELSDRAAIHLSICINIWSARPHPVSRTVEEHFDYAVSLMNVGD